MVIDVHSLSHFGQPNEVGDRFMTSSEMVLAYCKYSILVNTFLLHSRHAG
ncbi:hypothetical protein Hanom_Chr08g00722441 [Helianthus anomalus]